VAAWRIRRGFRRSPASYRGDYSFEIFNDDYKQLPLSMVAARARRSVKWITGLVSRRSLPARRIIRTVGR